MEDKNKQPVDGEIPVETTDQQNGDVWNYYNGIMNTVPTFYRPTGNPNTTPKKPKRRNVKHGNRKKK